MITFGVLGAAAITPRALIYPCVDAPQANIRTIAARDRSRAEKMAEWAGIRNVVDDYQAVIDDPKCNAIYIPLPITAHHEWTLKALEAGKHVLCEKSIAANAAEAQEMAARAKETGLVLLEAFHYRYHPCFLRAKEIFDSGVLGTIETIEAGFCIQGPPPETDIRMIYAQGGGTTMDLGCYPISWVRHLMDSEPVEVIATAIEGPPNVDLRLFTEMRFADQTITEQKDRRSTYGYQLDAFIRAVEQGEAQPTDGDDAVKQMQLIDRCYEAAGMKLRGE